MKRRRNADEHRRRIERSGDPAEILLDRVRRGEVTQAQVDFAARLDDPAALALMTEPVKPISLTRPDGPQALYPSWFDGSRVVIEHAGDLLRDSYGLAVALAADCAERVLPVFEQAHPDDARPRQAIEAARGWLVTRSTAAVHRASFAAEAAAYAGAVAYAVAGATEAAGATAWAASAAARANVDTRVAASAAARAVADAADAIYEADARAAERAWQQQRLADYVLGRVQIPRPAQRNPPRRRNADERRRRIERSGDPAEILLERMRGGEVTQEQVDFAARLDDPAALALMTEPVEQISWTSLSADRGAAIEHAGELLHDRKGLAVAFAADCAEHVLPVFERAHPNDARPRQAIDAARGWLGTRSAAAAYDARAAAARAGDAGVAASYAARLAAGAATGAASAAGTTGYVAEAAANNAIHAAAMPLAERAWQKQRLADYVLGRVQIPRPARGSP